jgi:hypothetical protein
VFTRVDEEMLNKGLFTYKKDCTGKYKIHPLVRTVSCHRYLAYGDCFDRSDEYLHISESSMSMSLNEFCKLSLVDLVNTISIGLYLKKSAIVY